MYGYGYSRGSGGDVGSGILLLALAVIGLMVLLLFAAAREAIRFAKLAIFPNPARRAVRRVLAVMAALQVVAVVVAAIPGGAEAAGALAAYSLLFGVIALYIVSSGKETAAPDQSLHEHMSPWWQQEKQS